MILPEKGYKRIAIITFYVFLAVIITTIFLKYLLGCFLPFLIAFLFAHATRKITLKFCRKIHVKRNFSVFTVTILLLSAIFLLFYQLISITLKEVSSLVAQINNNDVTAIFSDTARIITSFIKKLFPSFSIETTEAIEALASNIDKLLLKALEALIPYFGSIIGILPDIFLFIGVVIIAAFYFGCDYEKIASFIKLQFSQRKIIFIKELKSQLISTITKIVKAYTLLSALTFLQLLTGFIIAGIDYPLLLALLISIIDILPVLGTGTILIPWCAVLFLSGNIKTGLCILILYVIITITRQIAEPKILGNSVGLHPLVTLMAMYFGIKLIGIKGLFIFPFAMIIVKNLNEKGVIHLYRNPNNNKHKPKEKNL